MPVIKELRRREMGTILNYSVEVSHADSEKAGKSVSAAEVQAANRADAETRVLETIDAIEVSGIENKRAVQASGGKEVGSIWLALKLVSSSLQIRARTVHVG